MKRAQVLLTGTEVSGAGSADAEALERMAVAEFNRMGQESGATYFEKVKLVQDHRYGDDEAWVVFSAEFPELDAS